MFATIIIGLPGSGKTHLAKMLEGFIIDDLFKNYTEDEFDSILKAHSVVVLTDPLFCFTDKLKQVEDKLDQAGFVVKKIYFENNKTKALANIKRRNDGREVRGLLEHLSQVYNPVDPIEIFTV